MEKRFKNGLVLGKFYPPHMGHLHLINTAIAQCERVHVMVCTLKREHINGILRAEWLGVYYKDNPNVKIIHCTDENPQYPSECSSLNEFYLGYWVPTVYKNVKVILDAVFTSEDYGEEFASYLRVEHVLVDKLRETFPVSGTVVRSDPHKYWEFLTEEVKSYYRKKVVIMGPESTGKSTLVKTLAQYFNCEFVEEFGRDYTCLTGTKDLRREDFENIAHWHRYKVKNTKFDKMLIVDTEAITTKIFGQMYLGGFSSLAIEGIIANQQFDLYLLLDIDVPWIDDGTRDFQHGRKEHLEKLKKELEMRGISYKLIGGNYEERFQTAANTIRDMVPHL